MSDQTQPTDAQQPTPTPPTTEAQQQQQPGPVPYDRFAKVNDEAKQLKARLAELEAADKQRKEAELTELQKWQKTAAEHEAALKAERLNNAKLKIAAQKGLPADLVDFLQGDSEEAITATADRLLQFVAKPAPAPGVPPSRGGQPARLDINSMTPEEIRKHKAALYKQAGIG